MLGSSFLLLLKLKPSLLAEPLVLFLKKVAEVELLEVEVILVKVALIIFLLSFLFFLFNYWKYIIFIYFLKYFHRQRTLLFSWQNFKFTNAQVRPWRDYDVSMFFTAVTELGFHIHAANQLFSLMKTSRFA